MHKNKSPLAPGFLNNTNQNSVKDIFWIGGVAVVYYLAAWLSLQFIFEPGGIAALWLGSGIFLSALILSRKKIRPYLAVVLFLTDFIGEYKAGIPLKLSLIYAVALTVEAIFSTWVMIKLLGENINFNKLKQVIVFVLMVVVLNNGITANIVAAGTYLFYGSSYWMSFQWWFISGAVGNLMFTPLILSWADKVKGKFRKKTLLYDAELTGLIVLTIMSNFIFFKYFADADNLYYYLNFLTIPFFIWAALRFGIKGVASIFILLALIIFYEVYGGVNFLPDNNIANMTVLIEIQFFISIIAVGSFVLSSIIAERTEITEQLQRSNDRWKFALEGAGEGAWDWNANTNEVFYSEQWKSMLGYGNDEIENYFSEWEKLVHPEDKEKAFANINAHLIGKTPYYENEHRLLCKDGNYKWILVRGKVMSFNKDGTPLRIIGTHTDISQLKEAQLELAESLKKLDLFFSQSLDGFFFMMLDEPIVWNDTIDKEATMDYVFAHQKITRVNDATLMQYKAKGSEFLGLTPNDFFKHDIEGGKNNWRVLFDNGKLQVETDGRRFDGSTIYIEGDYVCMYDETGRITGHFGIQRDVTIRKEEEEELKKLSLAVHQNSSIIIITDFEGSIEYVNQAFIEVTGYSSVEVMGKNPRILNSGNKTNEEYQLLWKTIKSGEVWKGEFLNKKKNGQLFYESASIFPLLNKQGTIINFVAVKEDITERKKMEEKLAESEKQYKSEFENSIIGKAITALNGTFIKANKAFSDMLGYSNEEFQELGWKVITHPDDIEISEKNLKLLLKGNAASFQMEKRYVHKNGSAVLGEVRTVLVKDKDETPLFFMNSIINITERKQAEQALKNSEEKQRTILETIDNIVALLNKEGDIIFINRVVEGFKKEDLLGTNYFSWIVEEDLPLVKETFYKVMATGEFTEIEFRGYVANKEIGWFNVKFNRMSFQGNSVILTAASEITNRIKAENEIKQLNEELEQKVVERTQQLASVNKELQAFTYSVSHDLKAPLRGIEGYSKLLKDLYGNDLNKEAKYFVQSIRKGANQMNQLIEDLLEYSRLERINLKIETIHLQNFCAGIIAQFELEISKEKIMVETAVPDIQIIADSKGLSIALRNLMGNAIKFSSKTENPAIKIELEEKIDAWILSVKDNGIGFDMKYKDRIFEIFEQLNLPEEYAGTGMGLAMVHKAMLKMGGKVWAESAPGKGAAFYLQIPKLNT